MLDGREDKRRQPPEQPPWPFWAALGFMAIATIGLWLCILFFIFDVVGDLRR